MRRVATFGVDFLGCKVSHADAQDVRERLIADGHVETGSVHEVAVISACCVTREAVHKSRKAVRRAARSSVRSSSNSSSGRYFSVTASPMRARTKPRAPSRASIAARRALSSPSTLT